MEEVFHDGDAAAQSLGDEHEENVVEGIAVGKNWAKGVPTEDSRVNVSDDAPYHVNNNTPSVKSESVLVTFV